MATCKHGVRLGRVCADCGIDEADRRAARQTQRTRPTPDPDPRAWGSRCAGWRGGYHEKARVESDGQWRCRWCWQTLNPPPSA